MNYLRLVFIFLWLTTGCSEKRPPGKTILKNDALVFIANYYGEPYDSLEKYIVFQDTNIVYNAGLVFHHFYDKRNMRRNAKDVLDYEFCKYGVLVKNIITNNYSVYSENYHGYFSEKGTYVSFTSSTERAYHYTEYYKKILTQDSFAMYYLQQSGVSMKLSAILNDMPQNIRRKMDKITLDSVFRSFFFEPYQKAPAYDTKLLSKKDTTDLDIDLDILCDFLVGTNSLKKYYQANCRLCSSFQKYVAHHYDDNNFFVYNSPSIFINGYFLIITLNENLRQDSLQGENGFYTIYDNEPILYDVKIYSPFQYERFSKP